MALQIKRLYEFGHHRLDATKRLLLRGDEEVVLPPKEFDLLLMLLESNGRVIEKDQLLESIWPDVIVEEGTLTRTVSRLRSRLSEPGAEEQFIKTVPRRGYRFLAEVRLVEEEEPPLIIEEHSRTRIVVEEVRETKRRRDEETERRSDEAMRVNASLPRRLSPSPRLPVSPSPPLSLSSSPRLLPVLAASLVAVAALGAVVYFALNRRPARTTAMLAPVPFSSLPGREEKAAFSPDGNQLAFAWDGGDGGDLDIYVKLIGIGPPLRLTSDSAEEQSPVWSPDGRYVAFIRMGATQHEALIVPALGGPERKAGVIGGGSGLAWSPDGSGLALADNPQGQGTSQIMLVSIESGAKRPLTTPPPTFGDTQPVFSPDGRQLAFVRTSNLAADDIYVKSLGSGEEKRLTTGSRNVRGLDWTADGREIVYGSTRAGSFTLWRVAAAGGEPEGLPGVGWKMSSPAISLQGGRLAFTESYDDTNITRSELSRHLPRESAPREADSRSDAPTPFIASKHTDDSQQYSPDGKKIAFVSERSGSAEIWICSSDGGNPAQLTRMLQARAGTPRWSPDGKHLVFDARPDFNGDLFVIDVEGRSPRRLIAEPSHDVMPSWSRDGRWIYFCSNRGGDFQIWKVPAEGGQAVQVTRKGGFEAFEAPDGNVIYSKWRGVDGLWTVPADGGEEHPVPELARAGYWRSWAVTDDGIYFVAHEGAAPPRPLKFFSFATRQVAEIGIVEKEPLAWTPSLAVSPDGRWLLYAQLDGQVSNIMLVENFR